MACNEQKLFIKTTLDIAEGMMQSGAEIDRVENTVNRMAKAFGVARVNTFAITSSIVVTMEMPDGETLTETRRIVSRGKTDFTKLEALNCLSREYCAEKFSVEELKRRFDGCNKPFNQFKYYIGSVIAAAVFAVFFGGNLFDALVSAAFAVVICAFSNVAPKFCPNNVISTFLCSLIVGLGICAVCRIFSTLNADMIMIGDIMLLIPGIALTNSIRNLIVGDTVSGLTRFTESLVLAGALAGGFMLSIVLLGGAV